MKNPVTALPAFLITNQERQGTVYHTTSQNIKSCRWLKQLPCYSVYLMKAKWFIFIDFWRLNCHLHWRGLLRANSHVNCTCCKYYRWFYFCMCRAGFFKLWFTPKSTKRCWKFADAAVFFNYLHLRKLVISSLYFFHSQTFIFISWPKANHDGRIVIRLPWFARGHKIILEICT